MDESYVMLTVYFDDPFWVGVFERAEGGKLSAARITFGAEPKDHEVWERYCGSTPGLNSVRLLTRS